MTDRLEAAAKAGYEHWDSLDAEMASWDELGAEDQANYRQWAAAVLQAADACDKHERAVCGNDGSMHLVDAWETVEDAIAYWNVADRIAAPFKPFVRRHGDWVSVNGNEEAK